MEVTHGVNGSERHDFEFEEAIVGDESGFRDVNGADAETFVSAMEI